MATVTPGKVFGPTETVDNAKLNQGFLPEVEVEESDVVGLIVSADYVQGIFDDLAITVGSTTVTSALAGFTNADVGRRLVADGIPSGAKINSVSDAQTAVLSLAADKKYSDGVVAGTTITSATAVFSALDNGRTILGPGIPDGTTLTYVSPTHATMSKAGVDGTGISFHINGRTYTALQFAIVGRGKGFRLDFTNKRAEIYSAVFASVLSFGAFGDFAADGSLVIGGLKITTLGDLLWATSGINALGKFFAGGMAYEDAVFRVSANGDVTILDLGSSAHKIDTGAVNPAIAAVTMAPNGGAINNPTNLYLTCPTHYARIYYRAVLKDGVTNTDTSFVSASAAFTMFDVGKKIVGTNISAATYIKSVTNGTTVVLTNATTGTGTVLEWYLVPDQTDTLYDSATPTPISLTATTKVAARAYKQGEYSALTVALFDTGAGANTVPNPSFSPAPGSYGANLSVNISDVLAGSSIFYTIDGTTPTHDAGGSPTGTSVKISPANSMTAPSGNATLPQGTTTIKAVGYKSGVANDSAVVSGVYTVSGDASGQKCATPTFTPEGFTSPGHGDQVVTIATDTPNATIDYTFGGGDLPGGGGGGGGGTINGSSGTVTVPGNRNTALAAVAKRSDLLNSDFKTATYVFANP